MSQRSLGEYASSLSKTPLGIIALFVLLAESIAATVLGVSTNLSDINQTIVISFIVLFPVLVVVMFWNLIVYHNTKLYAPSEFPNHSDFLEVNSVKTQKYLDEFKRDVLEQIQNTSSTATDQEKREIIEDRAERYKLALELAKELQINAKDVRKIEAMASARDETDIQKLAISAESVDKIRKIGQALGKTADAATLVGAASAGATFLLRTFL